MAEAYEVKKKIVLLGDAAVGKTSLIRRFVFDQFDDSYIVTLGAKATVKEMTVEVEGADRPVRIKFLIYDILGQKSHIQLTELYYRGAEGALLVSDLTRKMTLPSVADWLASLNRVVGQVPFVLLANKADLTDEAAYGEREVKEFSKKAGCSYALTSAKTGQGVEESFQRLAYLVGEQFVKRHKAAEK